LKSHELVLWFTQRISVAGMLGDTASLVAPPNELEPPRQSSKIELEL
jgi:hypothetical protein